LVQLILKPVTIQASNEISDMTMLLDRLKQQLSEQSDFTVSFQFVAPLIKGDEEWWTFPNYDQSLDFERVLGEIGTNYVCFDERGGTGLVTRCVPFSSIVTVVYST
jgi:hypothetical protein